MADVNYDNEDELEDAHEDEIEQETMADDVNLANEIHRKNLRNCSVYGPEIHAGTNSNVFNFTQEDGLWMGAEKFSAAPFSVDMAGNITAVSAHIETTFNASAITAGSLAVTRTDADITQDQLNAGATIDQAKASGTTFISGAYINTGIIDASRIQAGTLSVGHSEADVTSANTASNTQKVSGISASSVDGWSYGADETYINGGNIFADTVAAGQIAANAITAGHISAGTISAGHIVSNTITTLEIGADAITSDEIKAGSISAGHISANTITTNEIAGNAGTFDLSTNGGVKFQMPTYTEGTGNGGLIIEASNGSDRLKMNDNAFITHEGQAFAAATNTISTFGNDWFQMYGQNGTGVLIMPTTNEFELQQNDNSVILDVNENIDSMAVNNGYSIGSPNVGNMIVYDEINPGGSWGEYQVRLDIVPGSDASGQIGNSTYAWNIGWFWTLYTDDGNVAAWQDHDDIQMIKDVDIKTVAEKEVKEKGPTGRHSEAWNLEGLPDEIQKDGKVSHGALNGLLIGTLKQLIDKVETLEQEVDNLK